MCDEWLHSFISFYNWCINNEWKKELSIDRKDSNKGYEPSNCRFATAGVQARNKKSILGAIKYFGVSYWKKPKKYIASLLRNEKRYIIGSFNTEIDAAEGRDYFIISHKWQDEYPLNFPNKDYCKFKYNFSQHLTKNVYRRDSCIRSSGKKFIGSVHHNGKKWHTGTFVTREQAIEGKINFIKKNFPDAKIL